MEEDDQPSEGKFPIHPEDESTAEEGRLENDEGGVEQGQQDDLPVQGQTREQVKETISEDSCLSEPDEDEPVLESCLGNTPVVPEGKESAWSSFPKKLQEDLFGDGSEALRDAFTQKIEFHGQARYYLKADYCEAPFFKEILKEMKAGEFLPFKWGGDELVYLYAKEKKKNKKDNTHQQEETVIQRSVQEGEATKDIELKVLFIDIGNMGPANKCLGAVMKRDTGENVVDYYLWDIWKKAEEELASLEPSPTSFLDKVKASGKKIIEAVEAGEDIFQGEFLSLGEDAQEGLRKAKNLAQRRQIARDLQKGFWESMKDSQGSETQEYKSVYEYLEAYRKFLREGLPELTEEACTLFLAVFRKLLSGEYKDDVNHKDTGAIQEKLKKLLDMQLWFEGKGTEDLKEVYELKKRGASNEQEKELQNQQDQYEIMYREESEKKIRYQIALFHEWYYLQHRDNAKSEEKEEGMMVFSEAVLLDAQGCESDRDFLELIEDHPEVSVDVLLKTVLEEDCEKGLHELKEEKSEQQYKSYKGNAIAECLKAYIKQAVQMSPWKTYRDYLEDIFVLISSLDLNLLKNSDKLFWDSFAKSIEKEGMGMGTLKYFLIRAKSVFVADVRQYDGAFVFQMKEFSELVQDNHPRSSQLKSASFFYKFLHDVAAFLDISDPDVIHMVHIEQNNTGSINALQGGYAHVDTIANSFPEVVREILGDKRVVLIRDGGGSFRLIAFDGDLKQEWVEEICNKMSIKCHEYLQEHLGLVAQAKLQIDGFGRMALKDYYPHITQKELEVATGDFFLTDYSFHHLSKEKVLFHQEQVSVDLNQSATSLLSQLKK